MDKNRQRNRVIRRRKLRRERRECHTLPVYKAAYDLYKSCRFRFRTVAKDCKATAHDVLQNLLNIMVDIEMVYWQVEDKKILTDTYRTVLKTMIVIRAMHDMGELSTQHYSIISQDAAILSKNMGNWNNFYNKMMEAKDSGDALNKQEQSGDTPTLQSEKGCRAYAQREQTDCRG